MWYQWSVSNHQMNLKSKFGYCGNYPNFKHCTLFVSGMELQTNRQTDNPITRCPLADLLGWGHKNQWILFFFFWTEVSIPKVEGKTYAPASCMDSTLYHTCSAWCDKYCPFLSRYTSILRKIITVIPDGLNFKASKMPEFIVTLTLLFTC